MRKVLDGRYMTKPVTVGALRKAIEALPPDRPRHYPGKSWRTQHAHWIGWLREYHGPGYYNRKGRGKDAKFAYNHIIEPEMLLWLARAARVPRSALFRARREAAQATSKAGASAAIRRHISWATVQSALWG